MDERRRRIDCYIPGGTTRRKTFDAAVKTLKKFADDNGLKFGEIFARAVIGYAASVDAERGSKQ